MTIFRLKQLADASRNVGGIIRWEFDRAELIADGVVHVVGIALGLIAATALIVLTGIYASTAQIVSVSIYAAGLVAMLGLSATYNLWPVSPAKWLLRRLDHSAIYVLIAATYTPFLVEMNDRVVGIALLAGVWMVAVAGIALNWPVSSTAKIAPVRGARMAPLMIPAIPAIAQKPAGPGRNWPSATPSAPPRISNGASTPPEVPDPNAISQTTALTTSKASTTRRVIDPSSNA